MVKYNIFLTAYHFISPIPRNLCFFAGFYPSPTANHRLYIAAIIQ